MANHQSKFRKKWMDLARTIQDADSRAQDSGHFYSIVLAFIQNTSFRMEMPEHLVEDLEALLFYSEEKDVTERTEDLKALEANLPEFDPNIRREYK